MDGELYSKPMRIDRTVAADEAQALAFDDKMRRVIVKALYRRALTMPEIIEIVRDAGFEKARTTVRYHMEILREAGVIDVAKIAQVDGKMRQYFQASTRLLEYSAPDDFGETYSEDIDEAARRMRRMLAEMSPGAAGKARGGGEDRERRQAVLFEIINRAMTRIFESDAGTGRGGAPAGAEGKKPAQGGAAGGGRGASRRGGAGARPGRAAPASPAPRRRGRERRPGSRRR